jgi:hypothetical protein
MDRLSPDSYFVTEIVDPEPLIRWDVIQIASITKLTNGEPYIVDAHGTWLTIKEVRELTEFNIGTRKEINWATPIAPRFAPR